MKSQEALNEIKSRAKAVLEELGELSDEELDLVTGGKAVVRSAWEVPDCVREAGKKAKEDCN